MRARKHTDSNAPAGRLLGQCGWQGTRACRRLKAEPLHTDMEKLYQAKANRADVRAAQTETRRVQAEMKLNSRLALPNPTVGDFGGHEQNTERFVGIGVEIPLPIFNRRQGKRPRRGASDSARQKVRATELNVEHEVRDAYGKYTAALRALKISGEDVVVPARESFGLLEAAFNAGKPDLLSLSVAERQSFDAQMGYLDAWFNFTAAKTSIDLALGDSA